MFPPPFHQDQDLSPAFIHGAASFNKLKLHNGDSIFFVADNLTRDYLLPQSEVNDASLSAGYLIYLLNKHIFEKF